MTELLARAFARQMEYRQRSRMPWLASLAACLAIALLLPALAQGQTLRRHQTLLPVGPRPSAIAAADLNGNGIPDIVTADRGTLVDLREDRPANDRLSVLFASSPLRYDRTELPVGFGPYTIAIRNMDTRRSLDIVVGSFHAAREKDITLCRNIPGEGAFEYHHFRIPDEGLPYTKQYDHDHQPVFSKPGITSLVVHDFNGDGLRDVVATGWSSDVLVFLPGDDETYLGEAVTWPAPGGPRSVAAADFTGNGRLDLVTAQYTSDELALWRGDGRGGFEEVTRLASGGKMPHKVAVADIDGDGNPDIVVSHCYVDEVVTIHYGEGGFSFPLSQKEFLGADRQVLEHEIRDVLVEDFTGNGRPDIAVACFASSQVVLLVNVSTGTGVPQTFRRETYTFPEGKPRALCAADFDQDGKLDLAVALWEPNAVALLLGR